MKSPAILTLVETVPKAANDSFNFLSVAIANTKSSKIEGRKPLLKDGRTLNCSKVQCLLEDKPICVQLKYHSGRLAHKTLYVVMLNKCELKYVDCLRDVTAVAMPMTHCELQHKSLSKAPRKPIKKQKKITISPKKDNIKQKKYIIESKKRMKRQIDLADVPDNPEIVTFEADKTVLAKAKVIQNDDKLISESQKVLNEDKNSKSNREVRDKEITNSQSDAKRTNIDESDEEASIVFTENNPHVQIPKIADFVFQNPTDSEDEKNNSGINTSGFKVTQSDTVFYNNGFIANENSGHNSDLSTTAERGLDVIDNILLDKPMDGETKTNAFENDDENMENTRKADSSRLLTDNAPRRKRALSAIHLPRKNKQKISKKPKFEGFNVMVDSELVDPSNTKDDYGVQLTDLDEKANYGATTKKKKVKCTTVSDYDKEQHEDCPTTCPARHVPVCARCTDHIYKTFLSVCHMRMFACKHPEEKLSVVSREACVLSAPFFNEGVSLEGAISEPNDDDPVLRYVWCKGRDVRNVKGTDTYNPECSKLNQNFVYKKKRKLSHKQKLKYYNDAPLEFLQDYDYFG